MGEGEIEEKEDKNSVEQIINTLQKPQIITPITTLSVTENNNEDVDEIEEIVVSRFAGLSSSSFSMPTDVVSSAMSIPITITITTTATTCNDNMENTSTNSPKKPELQESNSPRRISRLQDVYIPSVSSSFDVNVDEWSNVENNSKGTTPVLNLPSDYWLKKARNEASRLLQEWARDNMLLEHKIATVLNPRLKHLNLLCSHSERFFYYFLF